MASFKKTLNILFAFCMAVFIAGCANQLPPPGGDIDTVPPKILEVIPKDGTVNFTGHKFEITFSKYVNKRSVTDNIFISPKIFGDLEYSWSGKSLEVIFPDSLKKNTTYSVSIGADVSDLTNNNKMNETFSFAFSTGASIDTCRISGKVYEDFPSGIMIFAYKKEQSEPDISKIQPDYISQVGKTGKYLLTGLGYGDYYIFAMNNRLHDYIYKAGVDNIGIPYNMASLSKSVHNINDFNFFMTFEDTIKPHIDKATMTDRNHILLEFTKPVDSLSINASNFSLVDSVSKAVVNMKYFYKGQGKQNQYFLAYPDSLKRSESYYIVSKNISDKTGNKLIYESTSIVYNQKPDTVAPKILKMTGQYLGDLLDYEDPQIFVQFDDGFDNKAPTEGISVVDSKGGPLEFKINNFDNASFYVQILSKLKPKSEIKLKLDQKKFKDVSGKSIDSLYQKKFSLSNDLDFSGASGNISNIDTVKSTYVVLEKAEKDKKTYKQKVDKKGNFEFKKVVPGKYVLWSFIDTDGNNTYSKGKVKPVVFSEKFHFYQDTLNLRARWPVGDIKIQFENK